MLKYGDCVLCTSQEQFDRLYDAISKYKSFEGVTKADYSGYPHIGWAGSYVTAWTGWAEGLTKYTEEQFIQKLHEHFGITPQDDVIRVGDRVEVLVDDPDYSGWMKGESFEVKLAFDNSVYGYPLINNRRKYPVDQYVYVSKKHLKKIKAGGPIPTKQTTNNHGQVQRGNRTEQGTGGGATAGRCSTGRTGVVGSPHCGNPARLTRLQEARGCLPKSRSVQPGRAS